MLKVSVIIPVYNVEKYLGECLDSILGQTLKDIEVLCVDDGSTDGSPRILAEYAAKDARVKLYSSPHAGAFRAREVGVKAATGEFVYFMDADDKLETVAFEELCTLADRENLDQVVFMSSVVFDEGYADGRQGMRKAFERYYSMASCVCGKVMSGMELMLALQEHNSFHVSPPLRLTRTSVFRDNEYGFPDATSRADNYFTPLSLYYSRRAMAIDRKYYMRRLREGSITTAAGAPARHFRNILVVIAALCEFKPFAAELLDANSQFSHFIAELAYAACKNWAWELPGETRFRILDEVLSSVAPSLRPMLLNAVFLAAKGLSYRPGCSIRSSVKNIFRRIVARLTRKREKDWWI